MDDTADLLQRLHEATGGQDELGRTDESQPYLPFPGDFFERAYRTAKRGMD